MKKISSILYFLTTLVIILLPTSVYPQSQVWGWTATASSPSFSYEQANAITTDSSGNVITTGFFTKDTISFGTIGLSNYSTSATVSEDVYIAKYDANGQLLWVRQIGSSSTGEKGKAVATDSSESILVAGEFAGDSIVMGGATFYNHPGYKQEIFLARYSPTGTFLWGTTIGHTLEELVNDLHIDAAGNIFLCGSYASDSMVIGNTALPPVNGRTGFFVKFDPNGNPVMVKYAVCTGASDFTDIVTDANGDIIVSGFFNASSIQFDATVYQNPATSNGQDAMIVKFSASGVVQWVKSGGGAGLDYANSISTDANGNIYTCGHFNSPNFSFGGNAITLAGASDSYAAKLDSSGNLLWLRGIGGSLTEQFISGTFTTMGDYLVTGWSNSPTLTTGSLTITKPGGSTAIDALLIRYSDAGNVLSFGRARCSATAVMADVVSTSGGRVYTSGYFNGDTLSFGNSLLYNLNSGGSNNLFVAELTSAITGIGEPHTLQEGLRVYPNPANNQITIAFKTPVPEIIITDLSGRMIKSIRVNEGYLIQVDIEQLATGVYLIDGGINGRIRFIKSE